MIMKIIQSLKTGAIMATTEGIEEGDIYFDVLETFPVGRMEEDTHVMTPVDLERIAGSLRYWTEIDERQQREEKARSNYYEEKLENYRERYGF